MLLKKKTSFLIYTLLCARAESSPGTKSISAWVPSPVLKFAPGKRKQQIYRNSALVRRSTLDVNLPPSIIEEVDLTTKEVDETIQNLRNELKIRLLKNADEFMAAKALSDNLTIKAKQLDNQSQQETSYVIRLLKKIARKISRTNSSKERKMTQISSIGQSKGILTSDSFRQMKLEVGNLGEEVISLAEQLSQLNPTSIPTLGFKNYGGAPSTKSKLNGNWKLRFTTAADASFPESEQRGVAITSQVIDAEKGTLTNVVDFEKGNLKGFRVVVEGEPKSSTDLDLAFRSVKILRHSRFPRLFGEINIRLPSRLIRWLASRSEPVGEGEERRGPYLSLKYLDEDLRIHITGQGNWFIQSRIS